MDFEKFVIDTLKDIKEKQEDMDVKQDAVIVQTTKTNGRLLKVEEWQFFINKLLWGALGCAIAVAGFYIQNYISKH